MADGICSVEGCGASRRALGFCVKHYQRFKKYGDPSITRGAGFHDPRPLWTRYWERVDRAGGLDACWPWIGALAKGYGRITDESGHIAQAHRVVLIWALGEPPEGMFACHACDIRYPAGDQSYRACCNPLHLFWGTAKDNTHDMLKKGRAWWQKG